MTNKYYKKNKGKLQKEARGRYQNLSEEEKDKKRQYACKRYRNLSEEEQEKKHQMVLNKISINFLEFVVSSVGWFIEYKNLSRKV